MENRTVIESSDREINRLLSDLDALSGRAEDHHAPADIVRQLRQAIEQRKRAEEALHRREHEFQALAESAADIVARFDRQFRHTYINPAIEKATGRPREFFLGKSNRELGMTAPVCDVWDARLADAFSGREVTCSFEFPSPDGLRYYEARIVPEPSGGGPVQSVVSIARDVTETRRVEEALHAARQFIRQVVDTDPNLIFVKDESGAFILVNEAMASLYGTTTAELAHRLNRDVLVRPEDYEQYNRVDQEVLRTQQPVTVEEPHLCPDGRTIWFLTTKSPIGLSDGRPGLMGVATDITQRKRAEEALRENDAMFRGLVNSNIIGIIRGCEERIDEANDVFLRMIGRSREELERGKVRWPDLTPPEYADLDRRVIGELCSIGFARTYEKAYVHKDGRRVPVMLGAIALSHKPLRWLALVLDLTELKSAQTDRLRLASLVENSQDFIGLARFDGVPLFLNSGGRRLVGLALDGPCPRVPEFLFPEDRPFLEQTVVPAVQREGRWTGEVNFRHFRTHEPVAMLWDVFRIDDPATGEPMCMATVSRDIRQRKHGEAERERLLAEARVAREEAEAANRAKDQFLAVLSHELRTPLTPVLTLAQLMARDPGLSPEQRANAQVIARNVELETRLIDDLLDLTRISRGKIELHLTTVDLHESVRQALEACEGDLRAKQLRLTMEMWAGVPFLRADAARLQQILWNLLKNAIKFTPPGGQITLHTENAGDRLRITVRDTGIGIDPEMLPRLFDAFEQGGREVTRQFGGLGLGLTISRQLVELQRGTLTAQSEGRGKGATFTLEFPAVTGAPAAVPSDSAGIPAGPARGGRLLLVEDHPDTGRTAALLLRSFGYEVRLVDSVASALQAARAEHFDLLLSDLGLPDGSGLDLMRQLQLEKPIKGIALSGYGSEEDIRMSKEAGFVLHLTKPISVPALEKALQAALA